MLCKLFFRIRERANTLLLHPLRVAYWSLQGMTIGNRVGFSTLHVTWPHQVQIGNDCRIEHDVYFHFDGIYQPGPSIVIGDDCFIGASCEFNITDRIENGIHILLNIDTLSSLLIIILLAAWALLNIKRLGYTEWIPLTAGFLSTLLALSLFPRQNYYMDLLAFLVPVALLIAGRWSPKLSTPGLALLLLAIFSVSFPSFALSLLLRFEERSSYLTARNQASYLLAHLPSPESVVALDGDLYDLYKPSIHHIFNTQHLADGPVDTSTVAGIVNCYAGYAGAPNVIRPLQSELGPSDFHLIQPAPEHLWMTLFGRRVTTSQWGYSCDLYVRNSMSATHSTNATP